MKLEQAKKYLDQKVYTVGYEPKGRKEIPVLKTLYIGGIYLFYNHVDFDVTDFGLYEDKKCNQNYGQIEIERFGKTYEIKDEYPQRHYFFAKAEAEKLLAYLQKTEPDKQKTRDIEHAKELLEQHDVNYEIFN